MSVLRRGLWVNFVSLLPATTLTILLISIAFLRFYDERDFQILGVVTQPRLWSNRFTVAAVVVAVVNFCVEWHRRNRETSRLEENERRRSAESARAANERAEARERASRRARIEARCRAAQIRFQLVPNEENRGALVGMLSVLDEYGETF